MTMLVWGGFLLFIGLLVALDLGVFHRKSEEIKVAEALIWTLIWICVALVFNLFIYLLYGQNWGGWADITTEHLSGGKAALQFFTGYLVEKSLSIDNIFVIAMIFSYLKVPLSEQHRVLFWGILGAVVMRGVMILGGVALIDRYSWLIYVFGVLLILSAIKMMVVRHDTIDPDKNLFVRLVKRFLPVSDNFSGNRFFIVEQGRRVATPLFLALILVESSDVMFAIDSIPAIMAITRDPFLIFTSNVFAILGLRSLYFALAGMMERFRYLKMSLVFLLAFIGVKMLLSHHHPIPNLVSLAIIAGILAVGIGASLLASHRDPAALASPLAEELEHLAEISYQQAKRLTILIVGSTLLLVGIVMLVLPGPGTLVIIIGLTVLAAEFAWARLWLRRVKRSISRLKDKLTERFHDE
ncbi:tellurite resistance protein TerC [Malonomonas rubra DSM 5091]|uniref:Tellurite resistance protein TerC n=1 Tax=Malonomonas rubra DSM 5091 TaxID=1122189 RepID=A0A1M6MGT0_MALRU|nr:TerC/Alx family metal homeostasis membrane protein [Malonomonas rubra]SHJ82667.1 tellurite resistance protein TerC [Malonomonas rubra DSM 5091]